MRLAISGAQGRVGKLLMEIILNNPLKYQLEFALVQEKKLDYELCQLPNTNNIQVVIDFSSPSNSINLVKWASQHKVACVIGTTGFSLEELSYLKSFAAKIPLLITANTNLSVNLLMKLAELASKALPSAEIEIVDIHHRYKKDAPSGTALKLGEVCAKARGLDFEAVKVFERNTNTLRVKEQIGFSSLRAGDIVGTHEVRFFGNGEELVLKSQINDRKSFAYGALKAADFLINQSSGLYTMDDLLEFYND